MKEAQRKGHNMEKAFPGCLGRMVNLFDLSAGVPRNKLLTDKPHRDGSLLPRGQSDVALMPNPSCGSLIEDELIHPIGKANGTPMKMLLDQEMSKDAESKLSTPNVVAKLMGLDALPKQLGLAPNKTHSRGSQHTVKDSMIPLGCMEQEDGCLCLEKGTLCEIHRCSDQKEYLDVYKIWQQSLKTNYAREKLHQGRFEKNVDERKMALVRQKFIEAKRLATDEKLRQSKEFQDALEVLSSNKELFVKFLQEPNSLFSQNSFQLCTLSASPEKKCITILRPSKLVEAENFSETGRSCENQMNKPVQVCRSTFRDKFDSHYSPTLSNQRVNEYNGQPTRIVVLKPNTGKSHGVKAVVSQPFSSPNKVCRDFDEKPEDIEAPELREVPTEISKELNEDLMGHRRDETLISSVFSNGYTCDDSSFYKSENEEYATGDFSDLELMSPSSRHSWDYVNRFGSPFSTSSFARVSCSPESSVCREAKKRLSERWSLMASNVNSQEKRHVRSSSSTTLGEMLSLSDPKKSIRSDDQFANKEEEEQREFASCLDRDLNKEDMVNSPKRLQRSKSAPVSPLSGVGLSIEASDSATDKTDVSLEKASSTRIRSSFKGKISSLFFSRNKKLSKEKRNSSQCQEELQTSAGETLGPSLLSSRVSDDASCVSNSRLEECSSPAVCGSSGTSPDLSRTTLKAGMVSFEAGLPFTRHLMPGNISENQDHPSPCSVLEPPFDEDDNMAQGLQVPAKSNLIDKSPPIESIARTLTWEDDSYSEITTPYFLKPASACEDTEEEEHKWFGSVRTLLSAAGLDDGVKCDSFFSKWHSLENPLDPSLRNKYTNLTDKEPVQEGKRRQLRSNWKLIFDSVNAVLTDISSYESEKSSTTAIAMAGNWVKETKMGKTEDLVERVWERVKEWVSKERRCCVAEENGESNRLVVERVVGKEVVGKGWALQIQTEMVHFGKQMEETLLEQLLQETLLDLTASL